MNTAARQAPAPRAATTTRATPANVAAPACRAAADTAIDLVFVVDVSTSMSRTDTLRAAADRLFEKASSTELELRVGLTTFENDVIVHQRGRFLDREAFRAELDGQLVPERWLPNDALPRHLGNLEPEENLLDALARSEREFAFAPNARVLFFVFTDAGFLEPPAVFGDGTRAQTPYRVVHERLVARGVELHSAHRGSHGRGLSEAHRGQPGLVEATGGTWTELDRLDERRLDARLAEALGLTGCR